MLFYCIINKLVLCLLLDNMKFVKKSKIKNQKIAIVVFLILAIFNSCNKADEALTNEGNIKHSTSRNESKEVESVDLINLDNPMRDVISYIKTGGILPVTKYFRDYTDQIGRPKVVGNGYWPYSCSGNLLVLGYPGATCGGVGSSSGFQSANNSSNILHCPTTISDPFNNKIHALALYGSDDDRQGYYVYLPNNVNPNSKIVVLIHGGAWMAGPNPDNSNGWGSAYSTNPAQNNLVKNLITQGYAVVVPLYRLVKYGNSNSEFTTNTIGILDQVNDIDAAITHVRTNFPSCLEINANNIQILGESAGANLALLYAYTKANTSFVKSVISVAGPTNMNQFADYLKNKPIPLFSCGGNYVLSNPNNTGYTNIPYYISSDISVLSTTIASVSPLNCSVSTVNGSGSGTYSNLRITDGFNLLQSTIKQAEPNPLTSILFNNVSPCIQLTATRIIPTFIIHGLDDWIVPYSKSTSTMDSKLTSTGGLIGTYNSIFPSNIPASNQYAALPNKHLIKLFYFSNHDVSNHTQVLPDVITWFNGH